MNPVLNDTRFSPMYMGIYVEYGFARFIWLRKKTERDSTEHSGVHFLYDSSNDYIYE